MYLLVIILPFLNFLITNLFGRYIGRIGATFFTFLFMGSSTIFSLIIFFEVFYSQSPVSLLLFKWILINNFDIDFNLLFDSLTVLMLVVINSISFSVHIYSFSYMSNDPHIIRFLGYLSLFTSSMLLLISAGNILVLFIGWELIGISSYLLISFWFTITEANNAAIKAILINRFGDLWYVIAMSLIIILVGSLDIAILNSIAFNLNSDLIDLIMIFLLIAIMSKSSQLGLHTWLPSSMAGPTPVSALIHAATLVTAGIFLILRLSSFHMYGDFIIIFTYMIGGLTAFVGATLGLVTNDIKRIIAYSTMSQLGYMMASCGTLFYNGSIYHLVNHAYFKAVLFLSAGSIIHAIIDEQDIRRMGSLIHLLPITYICIYIASLTLMGIPFLTGWYSKEIIIESALSYSFDLYLLLLIAALFTSYYSTRILINVFFKPTSLALFTFKFKVHENIYLLLPILFLTFISLFLGYFTNPIYMSSHTFLPIQHLDFEYLPNIFKCLPLILVIIGMILPYSFHSVILLNRYYFDKLINYFFIGKILSISYRDLYKVLDRGILEYLGPLYYLIYPTPFLRGNII
jgi:NADH-ubiquinone oxidoreductase chain 5